MQKSGSNSNNPWNFSRKKLSVEKKLFDSAVKTSSVDSDLQIMSHHRYLVLYYYTVLLQ